MPHHTHSTIHGTIHGTTRRLLAIVGALLLPAGAGAAPDDPGRVKARQVCSVCHGLVGIAAAPNTPHLAGQPETYLTAQLRAFRSGSRRHEVMNVIASPLSDEEIAALARWFASIRIEAQSPQ
ncbi:MAG: cytochrome c [Sulfuritalea sp.]|nr:cytochrome c [Sulfuritalea sp.]